MDETIHILMLEDVPTDAELSQRELTKAGLKFTATTVATRDEFIEQLRQRPLDVVLADFSLPGFSGEEALTIAQEMCPEVPFVFVSGAIGEESAIEILKKGATDYVLKQRLARLAPAVRRALQETEERESRKRAEEALRRSEERHRALLQINNAIIANLSREALFRAIARALEGVVSFDRTSLAMYDPDRDALIVFTVEGSLSVKRFGGKGTELALNASHVGFAFTEGRSLLRRNLERDAEFPSEKELAKEGIRSFVVVPLIGKTKTLGTLNVASAHVDQYSMNDQEFLEEVGKQIALAVENMQAYEEIATLKSRLEQENLYLQEELKTHHNFEEIIGECAKAKKVLKAIETVAPTDTTVLITGETGTGKELVARALHNLSSRATKPLVRVNCGALPATLIESELFGHERGSFTGAHTRKIGRFELANGGTIFLDEIGDLPLDLQVKLLRVLQEREMERVGGGATIHVDVRVIAATNRDLETDVREGRFRSDLFYRLNVFPIDVPPLRERREDVPLLVRHFVQKYATRMGRSIDTISHDAMTTLAGYTWPGNIREMENVIERAVILSQGSELKLGDWVSSRSSERGGPQRIRSLDELQRDHIQKVLELTGGQVSGPRGAAQILGMKPTTLDARMKKLGIQKRQSRLPADAGAVSLPPL